MAADPIGHSGDDCVFEYLCFQKVSRRLMRESQTNDSILSLLSLACAGIRHDLVDRILPTAAFADGELSSLKMNSFLRILT